MFNGRFGDFYLFKIWFLTVFVSPFFYSAIYIDSLKYVIEDYFVFVFLSIIVGSVLCIPSFILNEILYKYFSYKKLSDKKLFYLVLIVSVVSTNITYFYFLGVNAYAKLNGYIFSLIYTSVLLFGFYFFNNFFFKSKISN